MASGNDDAINRPFGNIHELARPTARRDDERVSESQESVEQVVVSDPVLRDEELFRREMDDVQPVGPGARVPPRRELREDTQVRRSEDDGALKDSCDLVEGRAPFDPSDSDEHIEMVAPGVDRRVLKKLKRGEFSVGAALDLHGKTRDEARPLVEQFLGQSRMSGHRCVVIVHGRGHHSKDQVPVLKESLTTWLSRGRVARAVLAYCSARPTDGGVGAVYVLLRK